MLKPNCSLGDVMRAWAERAGAEKASAPATANAIGRRRRAVVVGDFMKRILGWDRAWNRLTENVSRGRTVDVIVVLSAAKDPHVQVAALRTTIRLYAAVRTRLPFGVI